MSHPYYIVDAFAENAFSGVPVAVFPAADTISQALAKTLAGEMLAADVVFIRKGNGVDFSLQAFHEGQSASAGAHCMIAAASGLIHHGLLEVIDNKAHFLFEQAEVHIDLANTRHPILISQKIEPTIDRYTPGTDDIASTIGLNTSDISTARYTSLIVSCGKPYLFVPLKSYHALREAAFHNREWSQSSLPQSLVDSLILFAPNTDNQGGDFHARLLERGTGATSDPAIGEAMPAFAAYLCEQQSVQQGTHSFSVRRGANGARQSLIQLEMDNSGEPTIKIRIGGSTAITSKAELLIDQAC